MEVSINLYSKSMNHATLEKFNKASHILYDNSTLTINYKYLSLTICHVCFSVSFVYLEFGDLRFAAIFLEDVIVQ